MNDICRDTRLADGVLICYHQGVFVDDIQRNTHICLKMVIVALKQAIIYTGERGKKVTKKTSWATGSFTDEECRRASLRERQETRAFKDSIESICGPPNRYFFVNFQEKFLKTTSRCHLCITHRTYLQDVICR